MSRSEETRVVLPRFEEEEKRNLFADLGDYFQDMFRYFTKSLSSHVSPKNKSGPSNTVDFNLEKYAASTFSEDERTAEANRAAFAPRVHYAVAADRAAMEGEAMTLARVDANTAIAKANAYNSSSMPFVEAQRGRFEKLVNFFDKNKTKPHEYDPTTSELMVHIYEKDGKVYARMNESTVLDPARAEGKVVELSGDSRVKNFDISKLAPGYKKIMFMADDNVTNTINISGGDNARLRFSGDHNPAQFAIKNPNHANNNLTNANELAGANAEAAQEKIKLHHAMQLAAVRAETARTREKLAAIEHLPDGTTVVPSGLIPQAYITRARSGPT